MHIADNKLVIPKDLPKDAGNNLEHQIYSIMKRNELLAEHTIKTG